MDDLKLSAKLQGTAKIDANPCRLPLCNGMFLLKFLKGRQKLHLDQDVPANAVLVLDHLVILKADHIGIAL